jgi:MoxR-like ATPase
LLAEAGRVLVGQDEALRLLLAAFFARGHVLIEGVPGVAKTLAAKTLAHLIRCEFKRVQFTPDLMPSDITGSEILFEDRATGHREFRFVKGPVFNNIVLADEINRTPPKTQSALLQAMQEHEVTSSGSTFPLPDPFWVLATQNPIEQEGTYPLPEAQQDRFMFSIEVGYPDKESELEIVRRTTIRQTDSLSAVCTAAQLAAFRGLVWRVPVADSVVAAAVALARATRPEDPSCPEPVKKFLTWGAGPRASQYLILAAKAYAVLDGRPTIDAHDVKRSAYPVLRHRLVRSFNAEAEGVSSNDIIGMVLEAVAR